MYIGRIVNYGGNNGMHSYGFVRPVGYVHDVYFHFSAIKKYSRLNPTKNRQSFVGTLAVYELDPDAGSDRPRVKVICLADELTPQEVFDWLNSTQKANPEVIECLKSICPEYIYKNNWADYFADFAIEKVRKLLYQKWLKHEISGSLCAEIIKYIESKGTAFIKPYIDEIPFEHDSSKNLEELIYVFLKNDLNVAPILIKNPDMIENSAIVKMLNRETYKSLFQSDNPDVQKKLETLIKTTDEHIVSQVSEFLPFDVLIKSPRFYPYISNRQMRENVDLFAWNKPFCKQNNYIVSYLKTADIYASSETLGQIASRIIQSKLLFDYWWDLIPERTRVRSLLVLSAYPEMLDYYKNYFIDPQKFLQNGCSEIVYVVMCFLQIYFLNSDTEKRAFFYKAHWTLVNYIAQWFNKNKLIAPSLREMLDKCQSGSYINPELFCDGRPWKNINRIYCPREKDHACEGKACSYFFTMSYENTKYRETNKPGDITLTDLLINIRYNPDIAEIKDGDPDANLVPWNYSFLLSGYVNQIIRIYSHMKCRCGASFHPNFRYAKKFTAYVSPTIYNCSHEETKDFQHDKNVYLNFCINCHQIIDSRECKHQDSEGYWICMHCGGSFEHKNGNEICPSCLCDDPSMLEIKGEKRIICHKCGHNLYGESWRIFNE